MDKIELLQNHQTEAVYILAYKIIENFFSDDPEDENLVPTTNEKTGELQFGINVANNAGNPKFDF